MTVPSQLTSADHLQEVFADGDAPGGGGEVHGDPLADDLLAHGGREVARGLELRLDVGRAVDKLALGPRAPTVLRTNGR